MRRLRLIIECVTPLHCGGGDESLEYDQPVTRDAFGFWRIPGSSIAGILRHESTRHTSKEIADSAFGVQEKTEPRPSYIWCSDGVLLDFDGVPAYRKAMNGQSVAIPGGPFVRDHVRLDFELGSAVKGGKFDEEIVPVGARFALEVVMDGWNNAVLSSEVTALFDTLCTLLAHGRIALGGKTSSGYGRYKVLYHECREFDLASPKGMTAWLNLSDSPQFEPSEGQPVPTGAPSASEKGQMLHGQLNIPFRTKGPLLVGGGHPDARVSDTDPSDADMLCVTMPLLDYAKKSLRHTYVVPGTSFKGVLRHRVHRILKALGHPDPDSRINILFGTVSGSEGKCGKVACYDSSFTSPVIQVQHVAIDRFTGGALEGALYSEAPAWDKDVPVTLRLDVQELDLVEAALLFHALLDMADGGLPIGAGGNRGNGVLYLPHWPQEPHKALQSLRGELFLDDIPIFPSNSQVLSDILARLDAALAQEINP